MIKKRDKEFIAKRLKRIIQDKNLTLAEVANISGVSLATISNVLRGKSFNKTILNTLSCALNINTEYLTHPSCSKPDIEIDINLYAACTNIVVQALKKMNINSQLSLIGFLQNELYYVHTDKELKVPLEHGEAFILGLIKYGMNIGTIIKNNENL